ncbi:hypothetical protein FRC17_000046 [Serendipita sp. 399]|nr:hypothetical protein FRC17_000046 [Serendipita sp. 399]
MHHFDGAFTVSGVANTAAYAVCMRVNANAHFVVTKLSDPIANTNLLNARLRSLGLYAAPTLGDGNCLFRALSDQLYGSHAKHLELRREICDFIESRKEEYAGFIDDEQGIEAHLATMRRPGEYGGHVELSVFARLKRRDVKVIQPDVCYVIEHKNLFTDDDELEPSTSSGPPRRKNPEPKSDFPMTEGTIYVAYHDWEHFSSVRNLKGPHHGLPKIQEQPESAEPEPVRPTRAAAKPTISKHKLKAMRGKVPTNALLSTTPNATTTATSTSTKSSTIPSNATSSKKIVVPPRKMELLVEAGFDSRESSPLTSLSQTSSSTTNSNGASGSSVPSSLSPVTPPDGQEAGGKPQRAIGARMDARIKSRLGVESGSRSTNLPSSRSPKRTFGESDLEEMSEEKDGSVDGRRVRRRSHLGSPEVLPSSSLTKDLLMSARDEEEEDDEDRSVLRRLLNDEEEEEEEEEEEGMNDDDDGESDSSLSPPPPDPKETIRARTKTTRAKAAASKYLHPPESQASQVSYATAPPSSVSPSTRNSPAPFEESSQEAVAAEKTSSSTTKSKSRSKSNHGSLSSSSNANANGSANSTVKLSKRQLRKMGLPKHGNGSVAAGGGGGGKRSNTVIVIPGGKHPSRLAMRAAQERERLLVVRNAGLAGAGDEDEVDGGGEDGAAGAAELKEWEKNGSGRKDSRGFVVINI